MVIPVAERSKARVYGDRLLGLRVRIPPATWMFVLCVLHSKDKRQKLGQSGQRSTDKVKERTKKGV